MRAARDTDFKITHPRLHHQLTEIGREIIGTNVSRPMDIGHARCLYLFQKFDRIIDKFLGRDKLGIGKPEIANAAIVKLTHFLNHFIGRIDANLLTFDDGVNAVAAVVRTATLSLYADIKIAIAEVIVEIFPNRFDIVVITGALFDGGGLLMDQTFAGLGFPCDVAAIAIDLDRKSVV